MNLLTIFTILRREITHILWLLFSGQKTGGQKLIGGLDCTVHRNFFGSQVNKWFFSNILIDQQERKEFIYIDKQTPVLCLLVIRESGNIAFIKKRKRREGGRGE